MNTAKNILPVSSSETAAQPEGIASGGIPVVSADMPVVDLLPRLLDSPSHTLSVRDGSRELGLLTETILLEGLAKEFAQREDRPIVTIVCAPADYSASAIAKAVEDAGVHVLDMWTGLTPDGRTSVSLRVGCEDPSAVVHSLERYGYNIQSVHSRTYADAALAFERLLALRTYMNV